MKVVEADSQNLPLEKRIQVLNDNRGLVVKTSVVFANSEFEIEAQNFRGGSVSWDFGDGPAADGTAADEASLCPRRAVPRARGRFRRP